ncbi:MAG: FMN-binding protein, partial [Oscillospiraceae bacterium]|nr:FMN-binding protein [Oscillospiraceae bacterium]
KEAIDALDGGVYGSGFGRVYINSAVVGKDASGNIVGYVISVTSADGNDGNITLSVGISADGTVNGIAFTELNETPGMGMRCGEPEFMSQFAGKNISSFTLVKSGASADGEVDAISGATVTSTAVVNAVNAGVDFYLKTLKGGN